MSSRLGQILIVKQTNRANTATVIFLHGAGDTGYGLLEGVKFTLKNFALPEALPHVKFLFPTAPLRPYIPYGGKMSHVWFNRYKINPEVPDHAETLEDIKTDIKLLTAKEVESGIRLNRIIIGGFSMGGALALHSAFRFVPGLAGVFSLSSFLNNECQVYKNIHAVETPLLMFHGERDKLVPFEWGKATFDKLTALGVKGEFIPVKNTLHELKKKELVILLDWITKHTA